MNRPRIGLNVDLSEDEKGITFFSRSRYARCVWAAGGFPVLLTPLPGAEIRSSLRGLKGLVMTGGDDLDPARFGGRDRQEEEVPLHPMREDFDLALLRGAVEQGLPTLAICLGMQELAAAFGGRLHQFLPKDLPGAMEHRALDGRENRHPLHLEPGSLLSTILEPDPVVNTAHRQAVREPGRGLVVAARTSDGVIEAIEGGDHPFLIGVQWHPDLMRDDPGQQGLFRALVEQARRFDPGP